MVMASGIVSVALRLAGSPGGSAVLLWIASAAFAVLIVVSAWRTAAFPGELRCEVRRPDRVFGYFAFPAAASVIGVGLASPGGQDRPGVVAALALATVLAWIAVTWAVVMFLGNPAGPGRAITGVNGTWQLWVVGTQSVAIAATSASLAGVMPARLAAWAALVAWSAGAALYPVITALVIARLRAVGLAPDDLVAPYWVTMGAASITAVAATQILPVARAAALTGFRPVLTGLALVFWSVATGLIPPLAVLAAARRRPGPARKGFRRELWMIVFPAGMYATASMRTGAVAGLPLIREAGTVEAWVAASIWAVVSAWMIAAVGCGS